MFEEIQQLKATYQEIIAEAQAKLAELEAAEESIIPTLAPHEMPALTLEMEDITLTVAN